MCSFEAANALHAVHMDLELRVSERRLSCVEWVERPFVLLEEAACVRHRARGRWKRWRHNPRSAATSNLLRNADCVKLARTGQKGRAPRCHWASQSGES